MLAPSAVPARSCAHGGPLRVLVIEGETFVTALISKALRYEGWQVQSAPTGAEGVRRAHEFAPDLVVLDTSLTDVRVRDVARKLHTDGLDLPLLFLVPAGGDAEAQGLSSAADDYVTKPFSVEEVIARLRAQVRRLGLVEESVPPTMRVGDLELDEETREVFREGVEIALTATEFELLRFMMRNPRRVISKAQILDRVWPYDFSGSTSVVELYISYLRRKIDLDRDPMIHTKRGSGYLLKPAA
ncbi:response regulator transcription factor [Ornithinimicrobium sediminis]|uniref:response regulator transcription factor n=1 Tax=Ornithinimicrobium sediminis TaxID=2904603 RepID=UPI001E4788AE|nr:response regulator transcription factor [Ornithinimicrobium sediminis]MCE0485293.1 response regulator transcription factor [Ornithinimicrobium sediminis]